MSDRAKQTWEASRSGGTRYRIEVFVNGKHYAAEEIVHDDFRLGSKPAVYVQHDLRRKLLAAIADDLGLST